MSDRKSEDRFAVLFFCGKGGRGAARAMRPFRRPGCCRPDAFACRLFTGGSAGLSEKGGGGAGRHGFGLLSLDRPWLFFRGDSGRFGFCRIRDMRRRRAVRQSGVASEGLCSAMVLCGSGVDAECCLQGGRQSAVCRQLQPPHTGIVLRRWLVGFRRRRRGARFSEACRWRKVSEPCVFYLSHGVTSAFFTAVFPPRQPFG